MTEQLVLVDYGSGNLRSAAKAVARVAAAAGRDVAVCVTNRPEQVAAADRLILPGVGAFGDCMAGLGAITGLRQALDEAVQRRGQPFLGICVGMQLMARQGTEHGIHAGLGWIDGVVDALAPADPSLKIPHMGWNSLTLTPQGQAHPVLAGLDRCGDVYFVHSYALRCADPADVLATTDYGGAVTAVVGRDTMIGTQFHPEKSQAAGLRLLANFLDWRP